jgi:hypothetical protein
MSETNQLEIIRIKWDGPYSLKEVCDFSDDKDLGGIYQVYGIHQLFGTDTLLYIGKASGKFKQRVPKEDKGTWIDWDSLELKFYLGRFGGEVSTSRENWLQQIDSAEKILIYEFTPPYNAMNVKSEGSLHAEEIIIFNTGIKHRLPQAVYKTNHLASMGKPWNQYTT